MLSWKSRCTSYSEWWFLWTQAEEWDCRIMRYLCAWIPGTSVLFSFVTSPFTFPPRLREDFIFCTFSAVILLWRFSLEILPQWQVWGNVGPVWNFSHWFTPGHFLRAGVINSPLGLVTVMSPLASVLRCIYWSEAANYFLPLRLSLLVNLSFFSSPWGSLASLL